MQPQLLERAYDETHVSMTREWYPKNDYGYTNSEAHIPVQTINGGR